MMEFLLSKKNTMIFNITKNKNNNFSWITLFSFDISAQNNFVGDEQNVKRIDLSQRILL